MTQQQDNSIRVNMIFIKYLLSFLSAAIIGNFIFLWNINTFIAKTTERLDKLEPHLENIQTVQNILTDNFGKHEVRITRLEVQGIK